ncbi:MAG: hypothetical protein M3Y58_14400 [Chloroflexota bacterium]|nr:hypothetical protein [Chloroflexota bacterium]
MDRFIAYCGFFVLATLFGLLMILIAPAAGAPDYVTFPGALIVTFGVFVVCVRTYTPGPLPRGRGGPRNLGIRLYNVGPSPTLEEVAEQLEEGVRKRRRGRPAQKRYRSHGKPHPHQ